MNLNPYYQVGWRYLIRMSTLKPGGDGPRWAERAREYHTANYALALLGTKVYPPVEAVGVLRRLLDIYAPTFLAEEMPAASAAFSETIRDVTGPLLNTPEVVELLQRACEVFPHSALLANLLGRALHLSGRHEESNEHYARALELRRIAQTYRQEFPQEDGTYHFWQFAEHIRSFSANITDGEKSPSGIESNARMLSVVVNFYNNRREALNTLYSLTRTYQQGAGDIPYKVLAVDNGSSQPLTESEVRAFGPEFRYRYVRTGSASPVEAINAACRDAVGEYLLVMIDGAHIVSPGVLRLASQAFQLFAAPFVATVPFHLGPKTQNESIREGYNQLVEDEMLRASGWKENGYRLYTVAGSFADTGMGWFGGMFESSCFGIRKADYLSMGGLDERYQSRGGGLVNVDFFERALSRPDLEYVMLLGEGTFHQFHGGVASNALLARHPWHEFHEEYVRIRGKEHDAHCPPAVLPGRVAQRSSAPREDVGGGGVGLVEEVRGGPKRGPEVGTSGTDCGIPGMVPGSVTGRATAVSAVWGVTPGAGVTCLAHG